MDETVQIPEAADSRRWIGRILVAVVLGEAIWGFLVSITNNLALPAMARVVGEDPQSPLYLGKGDFNVPALFASILQLCLAGIVAVVLNSWSRRGRAQVRTVRAAQAGAPSIAPASVSPSAPMLAPPVESRASATTEAGTQVKVPVTCAPSAPTPELSAAKPVKPVKPGKPKEVYYNIVGEPIETDDE
jgi:hypothetical protein